MLANHFITTQPPKIKTQMNNTLLNPRFRKTNIITRFSESVGKLVELKYKNSMDNIIERKGRLEKDLDWYYLYDEGKSGNQFNIAIQEKDLNKVVSFKCM